MSPSKSSLTLITPCNSEFKVKPRVTLFGEPLPVAPSSKILGVTWDRGLTFRSHVSEINAKAKSRLNVMKALSSTAFGHSKESLTALYKQFVRPVLSYGSTAWAPDLAPSHMEVLQRTQNAALRIATGCVRSTPIAHLHDETRVLRIKDHLDMRGTQFFAAASSPGHPTHHLHNPTITRRHHHNTPASHYRTLWSDIPPLPPSRVEKSWIHQHLVTRALNTAPPNSILGERPPSISPVECSMPRSDRVHLSRLRCGHHLGVLSYEHRIRPATDPTCRWCSGPPETVAHLFNECLAIATQRAAAGVTDATDLWGRPTESLGFLRSIGLL